MSPRKRKSVGKQKTAIVVPCHNEERRLDVGAFEGFLREEPSVVFIFVDDGSSDGTAELLRGMESRNPRCRMVLQTPNRGKASAVSAGFREAFEGDFKFIGFWDADLATPLDAIPKFLEILESGERDCVFGCRVARMGAEIRRRAWRHYVGRVYATLISMILRMPVYDTQCGAKIFRRSELLEKAFADPFATKWVFDVELIARMKKLDPAFPERIHEHPLERWIDIEGSKVSFWDGLAAFADLFRIWSRYG